MRSRRASTGLREHIGTHPWVRLPLPPDAPAAAPDAAVRTTLPAARTTVAAP